MFALEAIPILSFRLSALSQPTLQQDREPIQTCTSLNLHYPGHALKQSTQVLRAQARSHEAPCMSLQPWQHNTCKHACPYAHLILVPRVRMDDAHRLHGRVGQLLSSCQPLRPSHIDELNDLHVPWQHLGHHLPGRSGAQEQGATGSVMHMEPQPPPQGLAGGDGECDGRGASATGLDQRWGDADERQEVFPQHAMLGQLPAPTPIMPRASLVNLTTAGILHPPPHSSRYSAAPGKRGPVHRQAFPWPLKHSHFGLNDPCACARTSP
jgi:hypothetical protein